MRLLLTSLAAATLLAGPALAGETRVELRSGLGWTDGQAAKGTIGGAVGYDIATGGGTFIGVEESVDKQLAAAQQARWGTSARFGTHMGPDDKLYATAGPLYTKVEYKHYFNEGGARNSNAALLGVGMKF